MITVHVTVPVPPSVNNLYVRTTHRRGLARSKAYNDFRAAVRKAMQSVDRIEPSKRPWSLRIRVYGLERRRDLDNVVKPTIDAIVASGRVPDDRYLDALSVRRMSASPQTTKRYIELYIDAI